MNDLNSELLRLDLAAHNAGLLIRQIEMDQIDSSSDAARSIARKVENQHGFWDYAERRDNRLANDSGRRNPSA